MYKERALLRSIITLTNDKTEKDYLLENFHALKTAELIFEYDFQKKIYSYIATHISDFVEVPSYDRIKKKFEEEQETLEELDKIIKESSLFGSNFKSLLNELIEEQQKKLLVAIMKEAHEISETGKKIKKDFVKGPKKALEFLMHKGLPLLKTQSLVKTKGDLKGGAKEAVEDYFAAKTSNKFEGILTGLQTIDNCCRGMRNTELWLIVAYVSELKTTLSLNFAYTAAIELGKNIKFITLEMPYSTVRNQLIAIHSANLNLWPGSEWEDVYPLNFDDIMEGTLNSRQEDFLKYLCHDLDTNPEYGNVHVYQPENGLSMSHLKAWSEVEYKKEVFDAIFIDYIELMKDDYRTGDYTIDLNQRLKDLKQFALHFNSGKGISVVSAYQANRKGKEHADKNDGEYRLDALSYANEAERSADVIIYSYLNDELRANNKAKIGCLKNRSRPKFKQFIAKTALSCRKVYEIPETKDTEVVVPNLDKKNKKTKVTVEDLASMI